MALENIGQNALTLLIIVGMGYIMYLKVNNSWDAGSPVGKLFNRFRIKKE